MFGVDSAPWSGRDCFELSSEMADLLVWIDKIEQIEIDFRFMFPTRQTQLIKFNFDHFLPKTSKRSQSFWDDQSFVAQREFSVARHARCCRYFNQSNSQKAFEFTNFFSSFNISTFKMFVFFWEKINFKILFLLKQPRLKITVVCIQKIFFFPNSPVQTNHSRNGSTCWLNYE